MTSSAAGNVIFGEPTKYIYPTICSKYSKSKTGGKTTVISAANVFVITIICLILLSHSMKMCERVAEARLQSEVMSSEQQCCVPRECTTDAKFTLECG